MLEADCSLARKRQLLPTDKNNNDALLYVWQDANATCIRRYFTLQAEEAEGTLLLDTRDQDVIWWDFSARLLTKEIPPW